MNSNFDDVIAESPVPRKSLTHAQFSLLRLRGLDWEAMSVWHVSGESDGREMVADFTRAREGRELPNLQSGPLLHGCLL